IIVLPMFFQKDTRVKVSYTKYFSENKILTDENKAYNAKLKESYANYENGTITIDEYFAQIEEIRKAKNDIRTKQVELKAKYAIDDNLDLKKVVFSKDKKTDDKLKAIYLKSKAINDKDSALDLEEENLEKMYRDGTITKEEFKAKKANIEAREKEIEKEEEALDAEEEALDKKQEAEEKAEDEKKEAEDAANDLKEEEKDKQEEANDKNSKDEEVEDDKSTNEDVDQFDAPEAEDTEL
ncbi:MAG: hypothetical protein RR404_04005, partial [Bacilli bacterium]